MNYKHNFKNDKFMNDIIFKNKEHGYFVEIGACDGINESQCYIFEKQLNWDGICVEPQKSYRYDLTKNRKCVSFNAISDSNEIIEFTEIPNKNMCSGITKKIDDLENKRNFKIENFRTNDIKYNVDCITLKVLLDNHNSPKIIDCVAIDAEGCELCIVKKFFEENNHKYKVLAFSLETNKTDLKMINEILINNQYIEVLNPFLKDITYKNKQVDWEKYYIHKDIS
jgi:FkbM family methyltransferase